MWSFASKKIECLVERTRKLKEVSKRKRKIKTKIYLQIGTVRAVNEGTRSYHLDVHVVQSADTGGY